MQAIGYCEYCGADILEERDNYGEVKIEYTCKCNDEYDENKEDIDALHIN